VGEKEISSGSLVSSLKSRFGEHNVCAVSSEEGLFPLLLINLELKSPVSVLMTHGLSDFTMPVHEKHSDKANIELYFCLPNYWNLKDPNDSNSNWVYRWISRLATYVIDKHTWFGHGHTMPCGKEMLPLSETMKQNHFFLSEPMLLEKELAPLDIGEKRVHFLSIIPIFPDEMDYKQGKGTLKFQQKLIQHGITEKLDDYRGTVLRSKWRLFV
jgi:hypothetical protein